MSTKKQVGFSMRVQLEWLNYTANLVLAGYKPGDIRDALNELLKDKLSVGSDAKYGCRGKTIGILMKIWVNTPSKLRDFRDDGLQLFVSLPDQQKIAVHWGMSMAVYPYFGDVGAIVGRLLKLQDTFTIAQVYRRVEEIYGHKNTTRRATQRMVRNFTDWGTIEEASLTGTYRRKPPLEISSVRLSTWLLEATLHGSQKKSIPVSGVLQAPQLFPFQIVLPSRKDMEAHSRLLVYRHALDKDLLMLHE